MQLQKHLASLEQAGQALFAISYDPVSVLADFAARHGITYPLLSDEGSRVIRALGLYNQHLAQQAASYGREVRPEQWGVPYPGVFFLDAQGVVVKKWFEQGYRNRPHPALLLQALPRSVAAGQGAETSVERPGVRIAAWTDAASYRPYEKQQVHVLLRAAAGVHVYGAPAPEGMTELQVELAPLEGLEAGPAEAPAPAPLAVPGLEALGYEGDVEVRVPFSIVPYQETATLAVRVRYQACTATECYPPEDLVLLLPLAGENTVPG